MPDSESQATIPKLRRVDHFMLSPRSDACRISSPHRLVDEPHRNRRHINTVQSAGWKMPANFLSQQTSVLQIETERNENQKTSRKILASGLGSIDVWMIQRKVVANPALVELQNESPTITVLLRPSRMSRTTNRTLRSGCRKGLLGLDDMTKISSPEKHRHRVETDSRRHRGSYPMTFPPTATEITMSHATRDLDPRTRQCDRPGLRRATETSSTGV